MALPVAENLTKIPRAVNSFLSIKHLILRAMKSLLYTLQTLETNLPLHKSQSARFRYFFSRKFLKNLQLWHSSINYFIAMITAWRRNTTELSSENPGKEKVKVNLPIRIDQLSSILCCNCFPHGRNDANPSIQCLFLSKCIIKRMV